MTSDEWVARWWDIFNEQVWDGHWCRWRDVARRAGKDWRAAVTVAWTRTEAQYGKRPSNEETT